MGTMLALASVPSIASAQDLGFGAHEMPTGFARITPRWDNYLFTGNHTDAAGGGSVDTGGTAWASNFSVMADFRTFVVALSGDENVIEAAAPGPDSFRDRMQAVENFHGV